MEVMSLEEFRGKFDVVALTVVGTEHWTWSVRPVQATLGCGVLSLNRLCRSFGGITPEEGADLARIVTDVEARLASAFAPDKLNYQMLMMRDPHVHMHVFPRYEQARSFATRTWVDETWPGPLPAVWNPDDFDRDLLVAVRDRLAEA